MQNVYGYIRVSTNRQGTGASLEQQTESISEFAKKNELNIVAWFEEKQTAAKIGRAVFRKMIDNLKNGLASGVIMHKIDRSSRNLHDWTELVDMADSGIGVYFSHESYDMKERGGRLAADIQAVVSSDYIRNLRQETIKGFYGRLKQGLYPIRAPIGYIDKGRGNPKEIDPKKGKLIKKAFELYATGEYGLDYLRKHLYHYGLTNNKGRIVSLNGMSTILNNPFYTGVIRIRKTNEVFAGIHKPIINQTLFKKVQEQLTGRCVKRISKHKFTYSRMIKCDSCGYSLIAEKKKGYIYYRCHTKTCKVSYRSECIDKAVNRFFHSIALKEEQQKSIIELVDKKLNFDSKIINEQTKQLNDSLTLTNSKLDQLTDLILSGLIDKDHFTKKKEKLVFEISEIKQKMTALSVKNKANTKPLEKFLGIQKMLGNAHQLDDICTLRLLLSKTVKSITSNAQSVNIEAYEPFSLLYFPYGDPYRGSPRKIDYQKLSEDLYRYTLANPTT